MQVVDSAGAPVFGVGLKSVYDVPKVTEPDGRAVLDFRIEAGSETFVFAAALDAALPEYTSVDSLSPGPATIVLSDRHTVTGAVAGVTNHLVRITCQPDHPDAMDTNHRIDTVPDSRGAFAFGGIPDGTYRFDVKDENGRSVIEKLVQVPLSKPLRLEP